MSPKNAAPNPRSKKAKVEPATKAKAAPQRARGKGEHAAVDEPAEPDGAFRLGDLPVEVFLEIASRAHPLDLLHLARTNKTLRAVLMRRRARNVWQAAIRGVEDIPVPPAPEDMAEPAWVHLLFVPNCNACGKKGTPGHPVLWEVRLRLCPACRKRLEQRWQYKSQYRLSSHFQQLEFDREAVGKSTSVFHLIPTLVWNEPPPANFRECTYRQSDYDELESALRGASDAEERTAILLQRKAMMKERRKFALECLAWEKAYDDARPKSGWETQALRRRAIVQKLRMLGWGQTLDLMDHEARKGFLHLPEVARAGLLTDTEWHKIRAKCVRHLEYVTIEQENDSYADWDDGIEGWDGVDAGVDSDDSEYVSESDDS